MQQLCSCLNLQSEEKYLYAKCFGQYFSMAMYQTTEESLSIGQNVLAYKYFSSDWCQSKNLSMSFIPNQRRIFAGIQLGHYW